jgi:beta-lactamase superfamily II metal-dependent hydrolase
VILTHGDSGHIGGLVALFDDLTPRWIADTIFQDLSPTRREVHLALQTRGFGRRYLGRGDEIHLVPGVKLAVLYPPPAIGRSVSDDKAMCLRLEAAGRRVLFVSDAGFSTEEWLMRNEGELHADVLVKGWHSADLSGTPDFLARVQPGVIVSTAMRFGSTEAQALEWQRQVGAAGAALFAQDKCGAVRIEVAGDGELVVRPFIGGQIFRSRAR